MKGIKKNEKKAKVMIQLACDRIFSMRIIFFIPLSFWPLFTVICLFRGTEGKEKSEQVEKRAREREKKEKNVSRVVTTEDRKKKEKIRKKSEEK